MHIPPPVESHLEFASPPYPLSVKHASLENLLNVSYWLWRLNPLSMFPVILGSALEVLKQSVIVVALMFSLSQLASTEMLRELAESIRELDFTRIASTVPPIVSMLMPVLIITVSIYYVVSIIAGGFLNSAEYGSYLRLVRQGVLSLKEIFEEMRKKWLKISLTVFMVETIKIIPMLIAFSLIFWLKVKERE